MIRYNHQNNLIEQRIKSKLTCNHTTIVMNNSLFSNLFMFKISQITGPEKVIVYQKTSKTKKNAKPNHHKTARTRFLQLQVSTNYEFLDEVVRISARTDH